LPKSPEDRLGDIDRRFLECWSRQLWNHERLSDQCCSSVQDWVRWSSGWISAVLRRCEVMVTRASAVGVGTTGQYTYS